MDEKEQKLPSTIDFDEVINNATELFKKQATLGADEEADLEKVELVKAKANAALDAISNALEMSQLLELIQNKGDEFSRAEELSVMNPMLKSFKILAEANQKYTENVLSRLDRADEEELTTKQILALNASLSSAVDNTVKAASGLSTLMKLQKETARLHLGGRKSTPSSISFIKGMGEEDPNKSKQKRKLTMEELKALTDARNDK